MAVQPLAPDAGPRYPELLAGRYQLGERIGRGGLGVVFRVLDRQTGLPRAAKLLRAQRGLAAERAALFRRECEFLAQFDHPHVVRLLDWGCEGDLPFLIMELCVDRRGRPFSLADLHREAPAQRLSPARLERLFPPLLGIMAEVHRLGLVHRDLKPENVLLVEPAPGEYLPKLGDFSLVALAESGRPRPVRGAAGPRALVGTYSCMSPEQKRGEALDARSDVYSLGLLLYRLATGYERLGFELPRRVVPELPEWVDQVVLASLEEDREARAANAGELLRLLPSALCPGPGTELRLAVPPPAPAAVPIAAGVPESVPAPGREPLRSWRRVWGLAALLALLTGGLVYGLGHWGTLSPLAAIQRDLAAPAAAIQLAALARLDQLPPGEWPRPLFVRLAELLAVGDGPVPAAVAAQLPGRGAPPELFLPVLQRRYAGLPPAARPALLRLWREWGVAGAPLLPELLAVHQAPDDPLLAELVEHCGALGPAAAASLPRLCPLAVAGPPALQGRARAALVRIGVPPRPEYLDCLLAAGDVEGLLACGEAALPGLLAAASDPAAPAAAVAVAALGRWPGPPPPELLRLFFAEVPAAREAARQALLAAGPQADTPLNQLLLTQAGSARARVADLLQARGPRPDAAWAPYYLVRGEFEALAKLGAAALPAVAAALASRDPLLRPAAARAVARLGTAALPVRDTVCGLLAADPPPAAETLDPLLAWLAGLGPETVPLAVQVLQGGELPAPLPAPVVDPRHPAAAAAVSLGPGEAAIQVRLKLLRLLAQAGPEALRQGDCRPLLLRFLEAPAGALRAASAETLAALGVEETPLFLPYYLYRAGTGADAAARGAAIAALGRLGAPAVEPLGRLLRARPASLNDAAADACFQALGELGAPAVGELAGFLAAGELGPNSRRAVLALQRLGPPAAAAAPNLVPLLADSNPDNQALLQATFAALGPGALPSLVQALSHRDLAVRSGAARTLASLGPAAAPVLPELLAALRRDEHPLFRVEAAKAVAAIQAPPVAP